jgi:hypothetical protein
MPTVREAALPTATAWSRFLRNRSSGANFSPLTIPIAAN